MSTFLQLTPHDPLVARDGRPFGAGQGRRMRGLPWPLPSVVAGSFRTALIKAGLGDFSGDVPKRLMQIAVAGVFPVHGGGLYLPAPNDAVAEPSEDGKRIKTLHRVFPQPILGGCDLPENGLQPVMLSEAQAQEDFKPADTPAWWPLHHYSNWLLKNPVMFDRSFFTSPRQEIRDHVCLDAERGAAADGLIFATAGLNVSHLPRFYVKGSEEEKQAKTFEDRFAKVTLTARVVVPQAEHSLNLKDRFHCWHPLGGERRMAHWQTIEEVITGWTCPVEIESALATATNLRMILATPAIFRNGWKPDLVEGPLKNFNLNLVGVSNSRWKAVSGWSLAPRRGPKPIRRMVPAGSVYFFTCEKGAAAALAERWLHSVSDDEQEQRDGFGLALWGIW